MFAKRATCSIKRQKTGSECPGLFGGMLHCLGTGENGLECGPVSALGGCMCSFFMISREHNRLARQCYVNVMECAFGLICIEMIYPEKYLDLCPGHLVHHPMCSFRLSTTI